MRAEAVSSAGKRNQGAVSAELLWKPQGRDEAGGEDQTWRAPKQEPRKHGEAGLGGGVSYAGRQSELQGRAGSG